MDSCSKFSGNIEGIWGNPGEIPHIGWKIPGVYRVNACLKFERVLWNIERDINVKKMFVKKEIFVFPGLYFGKFQMHIEMHYIMR